MTSIVLPSKVSLILQVLRKAGHEAYIVGGCVRDSLIGREPGDWDITTSALPEQVRDLFRRTVDTGLKHGTLTVLLGSESFEVTTFRTDGAYSDGRHPDAVRFVSTLEEDLSRRDFTINAMAYSPETGLTDLFCGMRDLEKKLIRAVGNPTERFTEDALRMMRAVRFSAQLGFEIEQETFDAIRPLVSRLNLVSRERIQVELNKLLTSDHPSYFGKLAECGITSVIMPRFDEMLQTEQHSPFHLCDVGRHTLKVLEAAPNTLVLRLCALLHDTGKVESRTTDSNGIDHFKGHMALSADYARQFLRNYRYDNKTADQVVRLVEVHDIRVVPTLPNVRRLINRIGEDLFPDFMRFVVADVQGKSQASANEFWPRYTMMQEAWDQIRASHDAVSVRDLAVNGNDLISCGMKPGKEIGNLLSAMLEDVLEDPSHNNKEYLLSRYLPGETVQPPFEDRL